MATVVISTKYQVVIPSDVRDRLKLKPGQKVAVIEKDGVIHLIPIRPLRELKGMAAGITSKGVRDEGNRRLAKHKSDDILGMAVKNDPPFRLRPVRSKQNLLV